MRKIVELAHTAGMRVLVDEAHGTHFYFGEGSARLRDGSRRRYECYIASQNRRFADAKFDASLGPNMREDQGYVHQIINLMQTTSASYLLLVSLDITRHHLALNGRDIYARVVDFANYARREIMK